MFWKKRERVEDKELDRIGRGVLWSASASESDADRVAASPFLYARIAARIDEQARRGAAADSWFAVFAEAKRATAALALVAVVAFGASWFSTGNRPATQPVAATSGPSASEAPVSACSLSSADECAISNDDVLATMFAGEEEGQR
jgi:hypothetical protein